MEQIEIHCPDIQGGNIRKIKKGRKECSDMQLEVGHPGVVYGYQNYCSFALLVH